MSDNSPTILVPLSKAEIIDLSLLLTEKVLNFRHDHNDPQIEVTEDQQAEWETWQRIQQKLCDRIPK